MTAPLAPEPAPFLTVAEAARRSGRSVANIRLRCATDGLGFKPGGRGDWLIRESTFQRWMAGEVLK